MTETLKSMSQSVVQSVKGAVGVDKPQSVDTVASYLVRYLVQLDVRRIFTVPGDFTLPLMKEIEQVAGGRLSFVLGLNELNSGYSADAYSRVKGLAVVMVTFSVGSLSAFNAIAGMYTEHVPCLVLVGAPNSNSAMEGEIVHHTLGEARFDYSRRMAEEITMKASTCIRAVDFPVLLHQAVEAAFTHRRPVYLEIASNLASESVLPKGANTSAPPAPLPSPLTLSELCQVSDSSTLINAVDAVVTVLNAASRPVILGGGHLRRLQFQSAPDSEEKSATTALSAVITLLERSGFAYAAMLDAKAIISEEHPSFIGLYAGGLSIFPGSPSASSLLSSTVEHADCVLLLGAIQSDYATAGHTMKLPRVVVEVFPHRVKVGGHVYHRVTMRDFVYSLAHSAQLKRNSSLLDEFREKMKNVDHEQPRLSKEVQAKTATRAAMYPLSLSPSSPLTQRNVHHILQQWFSSSPTTSPLAPAHVLVDCGDSWMTGCKLRLPAHGSFAIQLQYGSLGWGVPAAVGYSLALKDCSRAGRLVVLQGDGGFQMTGQELSTLIRYSLNVILIVFNNSTYLVENEIVPGDFNDLVVWDYCAFALAVKGKEGKVYTIRAQTNEELRRGLEDVRTKDCVCVVEVCIARDDCNVELTEWAVSLHPSASRPPRV